MESFEYGRSDLVLLNMNIEYGMNKDVINRDMWFWFVTEDNPIDE